MIYCNQEIKLFRRRITSHSRLGRLPLGGQMLQDVVHCFLEVPQCESCGFESTSGRLETEVQDSVCFINHLSSPLRNGKGMWLPRWTSLLVVKGEATFAFDMRLFAQCTYVSKDHIYILHITYIISGVVGCWVSFNTHACVYIYVYVYIYICIYIYTYIYVYIYMYIVNVLFHIS